MNRIFPCFHISQSLPAITYILSVIFLLAEYIINHFNPLMPGGNKKVIHTKTNLQLNA